MSRRKELNSYVKQLQSLLRTHDYNKDTLVETSGQEAFEAYQAYIESAIEKCKAEIKKLPIGHRYTGKYFVKKPYTSPAEYECVEGSLFMREDLITWQRESEEDEFPVWHKVAYRDLKNWDQIKRQDGQPVYES